MKSNLHLCCMLLVLAMNASTPLAKDKVEDPEKKTATTKPAKKNAAAPVKGTPQATHLMKKSSKRQFPASFQPDPKSLGLGCASGED